MKKKINTSGGGVARAPDFASKTMKEIMSSRNKSDNNSLDKIDEKGEPSEPVLENQGQASGRRGFKWRWRCR